MATEPRALPKSWIKRINQFQLLNPTGLPQKLGDMVLNSKPKTSDEVLKEITGDKLLFKESDLYGQIVRSIVVRAVESFEKLE